MLLESSAFFHMSFTDILDILVIALIIYAVFKWIRGTSAMNIFVAVLGLLLIKVIADAFSMKMLSGLLGTVIDVGVIALIIIFQPEIRHFLIKIGSNKGITGKWREALNKLLGIKAAIPALKESKGGSIINISSTAGLQGFVELPGYTATKYAVRGLTKSVALDLGKYGIRVNSVHPGVIKTPMTEGMENPMNHVALHRMGEAEEVSQMVLFLASDDSSFSSGAEFVVDGGETAGLANH